MQGRWKTTFAIAAVTGALFGSACVRQPQRDAAPPAAAPALGPIPRTLEEAEEALRAGRKEVYELALKNLTTAADVATRREARVRLGAFYESESRIDDAAQQYKLTEIESPELAPYLRLQRMRLRRASGEYPRALDIARSIIGDSPATPAADSARIELPLFLHATRQTTEAESAMSQLESVAVDEFTDNELAATADALERAGANALATRIRYRLLREWPQSEFTERIYSNLVALPPDQSPIAQLDFDAASALIERLARHNRYDQALDLIGRTVAKHPEKASDPKFRLLRANALFNSRNYDQVVRISAPEDDPHYLDLEVLRARAFWRSDKNDEFVSILEKVIAKHPKSKQATDAKVLLSKYYFVDDVDYEKSANYLQEAIAEGSRGAQGENLWTVGWIYTLAHKDDEAIEAFDQYLKAYPDADYTSNVLFWSGKVHMRNGRIAERDRAFARLFELYPYNYYSYRARQISGAKPSAVTDSPYQFPAVSSLDDPKLTLIEELLSIGMDTEAARAAKRLAQDRPDDRALAFRLADIYARAGEPLKAMGVLQRNFRDIIRHGGRDVPQRFWEILYPRSYWDAVRAAAQQRQLDPYLVAAVIRQESGYDPNTVSNAGAVGLMQIMPNEVSRIAENAGLPPMTRQDLFHPLKNIQAGTAEIVQKLEATDGDMILAIAAYNAGEKAVGRWIANNANREVDLFIESIPFNETRLYVKSVLRNQYEYMRIYENSWSLADKDKDQQQLFAPSENR